MWFYLLADAQSTDIMFVPFDKIIIIFFFNFL